MGNEHKMDEEPVVTTTFTVKGVDRQLSPVSRDDLHAAMIYAYHHARSLKADSELLFQHGRLARSMGILISANEEMGKTLLLAEAMGFAPGDEASWRPWWEQMTRHERKLPRAVEIDHCLLGAPEDQVRRTLALVDFIVAVREWAYHSDYISGQIVSLDLLIEVALLQGPEAVRFLGDFLRYNHEVTDARIYALRPLVAAADPAAYLATARSAKPPMPTPREEDRDEQKQILQRLGVPADLAGDPKEFAKSWRKWIREQGYPLRQ